MKGKVLLYVPNLIGYLRIVIVVASFYYVGSSPYLAASLYVLSQIILDFMDGLAARSLNQCSKFGALFDMVLDRASMQGLLMVLHGLYPQYSFWIQIVAFLRLFSITFYLVWRHVAPKALEKGFYRKTFYFGSYLFEHILWIGSELFPVLLYLLYFTGGPKVNLGSRFGEVRLLVALAYICFFFALYVLGIVIWMLIESALYFFRIICTRSTMRGKVLLYVPNLIGYLRVVTMLASFYYVDSSPYLAASLYVLSQIILDLMDGLAARSLNQCSKFGALFDMVLDRTSMNGLLMFLHGLYPQYSFVIQIVVFLHFFAMMFYMAWRHVAPEALEKGFYRKTFFFGSLLFEDITLIGCELFPVLLYLLYFTDGPKVNLGPSFGEVRLLVALAYICFFFALYSFGVIIWMLFESALYFVNLDEKMNSD